MRSTSTPSSTLADGVADDGEVLEVVLRLLEERRPLLARDRRQGPVAHRCGPVAEPLDHRFDVELVAHRSTSSGSISRPRGTGRVRRQYQKVSTGEDQAQHQRGR